MKFSALPNEAKLEFINQVAAKSNRKLPEQIIDLMFATLLSHKALMPMLSR